MKKFVVFLMVLVAIISLLITGCKEKEQITINEEQFIIEVSFVDSVKATDEMWQHIIDVASGNVQQIEFTMLNQQGKGLASGGKTFQDNQKLTINQLKKNIFDEMKSNDFLSEKNAKESGIVDQKSLESIAQQRENLRRHIEQYADIRFTKLTLFVTQSSYKALSLMDDIKVYISNRDFRPLQSHYRDSYTWTPDQGKVTTMQYGSTKRQVYSEFKWFNKPFSVFGYTYEHDFFLNNYATSSLGFGTYLLRNTNGSGFPICTWATNMPNAYLDTRLCDENSFQGTSNEVPYTIGCGEGYNLAKNIVYWTQILTDNGNTNIDNGKLTAQAGTQVPVGCTSVWCSFSYQQIPIIGAWNIPVPGTISWNLWLLS